MKLQTIRDYWKAAATYNKKWGENSLMPDKAKAFAKMVMELSAEVVRLRAIADEQNAEFSEYTLMPFGQHKGKKLADVPPDYLKWWISQNGDRSVMVLEARHGNYAVKTTAAMKLRLLDYLTIRFKNETADRQVP